MNIHEYQAKELYRQFGVPTPTRHRGVLRRRGRGSGAEAPGPGVGGQGADPRRRPRQGQVQGEGSRREGRRAARQVASTKCKHLRRADARQDARHHADRPRRPRRQPPLSSRTAREIARELYLSALVDRATSRVAFIASQAGGMNIEEVAHDTPEKIITVSIDPATGYQPFHGRKIAFALGLKGEAGQGLREARRRPLPAWSSRRT